MVGKGIDSKSSRIFHQCYVKCCKLQNLTPLNNVLPSNNGKSLDFSVDRIKYADWGPILNSLAYDLSLHSICIRCRQQVKTVLEQIDCERLAKTVNKRAVILTNFMLSNLVEAVSQCLSNTTLLTSLLVEGLPLKIPYLNPLCEALLANSSLHHLYLPRCLVGDAGCLAICKAVRCLPNILTLDLSGCELTPLGASYIADLIKYQKIHRYSENWMHTLRYRLPELDAMAGLRRITLCGNPSLGDAGVSQLLEVLADDLWIKALDVQNCGLTEASGLTALSLMSSNTSLIVLDLRHNPEVCSESMSKIRAALRHNEGGAGGQYIWLSSSSSSCDSRSMKSMSLRNGVSSKDKSASNKPMTTKHGNKTAAVKKEKEYTEVLEEQLQEEVSHRQQLEELNQQLVDQMKLLKQQQIRQWANNGVNSSGSEVSWLSSEPSTSSCSSVPIDQNTLCYIQRAFQDIYSFIVDNQCQGQCVQESEASKHNDIPKHEDIRQRMSLNTKRAQSSHAKMTGTPHLASNKTTKSAHLLGDLHKLIVDMKPEMLEKHVGDTSHAHDVCEPNIRLEDIVAQHKLKLQQLNGRLSSCGSVISDSSDTLVCSPKIPECLPNEAECTVNSNYTASSINPRDAFSSSDEDT